MNKTLWVILLLLWMAGSAWWHVCKIKQLCSDATLPDSTTTKAEIPTTPPVADALNETAKPLNPDTSVATTTSTSGTSTSSAAPVTIAEPITEKELAEKEKFTSVFKPIDLYFPLSEANYIRTGETQKFFNEATKYLAQHKDKKLLVTGHTDNTGSSQTNMRLSFDRANDVKAKLRRSGIRASQIVVRAKGQTEPKADNRTMAGRKANRRVSVVIE